MEHFALMHILLFICLPFLPSPPLKESHRDSNHHESQLEPDPLKHTHQNLTWAGKTRYISLTGRHISALYPQVNGLPLPPRQDPGGGKPPPKHRGKKT